MIRPLPAVRVGLVIAAVAVALVSLNSRLNLWFAWSDMPQIDETHVYEQAVANLNGAPDHAYYAYGPLHMYGLSAAFVLYAAATGQDLDAFSRKVFFDYAEHLALSRVFCFLCLVAVAATVFFWGRRLFGGPGALIGATLCLLVAADLFMLRKAKIDFMLPVWQTLAAFALIRLGERGSTRDHVLAGLFIGLAGAVKPLIGFTILPAACIAKGVCAYRRQRAVMPRFEPSDFARRFFDLNLLRAATSGATAFFAGFPYALVNFSQFWDVQFATAAYETSFDFKPGYHWDIYVPCLGWPLTALLVLAAVYWLWRGSLRHRMLLAFPLTYLGMIAFVPVSSNFHLIAYPTLAAALGLLVADRIRAYRRGTSQVAVTAFFLWAVGGFDLMPRKPWEPITLPHRKALDWIVQHTGPDSRICVLGDFEGGPRIVDPDPEAMSYVGTWFDRGRDRSQRFRELYREAHAAAVRDPRFVKRPLTNVRSPTNHGAEVCGQGADFIVRVDGGKADGDFVTTRASFRHIWIGQVDPAGVSLRTD